MKRLSRLKLELWSKFGFCLLGIINSLPVVYHYIKPIYQLMTVAVFAITVWLIYNKKYTDKYFLMAFSAFIGSQFLATAMNYPNHLVGNVIHIVFIISICLIASVGHREIVKKLLDWLAVAVQVFSFCCAVFALSLAVTGFSRTLHYGRHVALRLGFHDGRLFGILNPNGGALLAVISLTLALYLYRQYPRFKKLLVVNGVAQFLYFSLQQSRGALMCAVSVLFLLTTFVYKRPTLKKQLVLIVTSFFLLFAGYVVTLKTEEVYSQLIRQSAISQVDEEEDEGEFGEGRELSVTSGSRMQIWTHAIKMGEKRPLFGYGYRNIHPNIPKFFSHFKMKEALAGGFHNVFLTVFVASGAIGLISFLLLLAYIGFSFMRYIIQAENVEGKIVMALALGYLPVQLVESIIMYSPSGLNIIFWCLVGMGVYYNQLWLEEGKNSETISQKV